MDSGASTISHHDVHRSVVTGTLPSAIRAFSACGSKGMVYTACRCTRLNFYQLVLLLLQVGYQIPPFGHQDTGAAQRKSVESLAAVIKAALEQFGSQRFLEMRSKCLSLDLSWSKAAIEWERALQCLSVGAH